MSKESQKVTETKERIKDSFFQIYATKKIEHITIKEISEAAHINRATFYLYFRDIYELLEQTEVALIQELSIHLKEVLSIFLSEENSNLFIPPLDFYQKNRRYFSVLLGKTGDPSFINSIKELNKTILLELIGKDNASNSVTLNVVIEYIASAHVGVISQWVLDPEKISPEKLGELIRQVTLHGTAAYLKNNI